MADCYIVRRGGTGGGGEKGIIDLADKECLVNMVKTWLFSEDSQYSTKGYILTPNAYVIGSYDTTNPLEIGVKYNYPTDFNAANDIDTKHYYSYHTSGYRLNKRNEIYQGSWGYFNSVVNASSVYISEDVECAYPEIKKHFGKWYDYSSLRYIDVVKYPAQNNGNVFTDYIICKQVYNGNTWLTTLALKNPSIVRIDISDTMPKAKLRIIAEYICAYTHSVSDYDPSITLNGEYTNNPNRLWYFDDVDTVLNGVAYTTHDILYEDGTLAMKANCTIDEVIQKE